MDPVPADCSLPINPPCNLLCPLAMTVPKDPMLGLQAVRILGPYTPDEECLCLSTPKLNEGKEWSTPTHAAPDA